MLDRNDTFFQLADQLARQMGFGQVCAVYPTSMNSDEQGYSGAKLVRIHCMFTDGKKKSFVCKEAGFAERWVMLALTEQKRGYSPWSYANLNGNEETAWFIMQDIRPGEEPVPHDSYLWKKQVATALAQIHADNWMCADKIPRTFHADASHWKDITTKISVDHLERQCETDDGFAARYAGVLPKLRKRGEWFAEKMTELYQDGRGLTMTHGDLQTIDGDHVRRFRGNPMVIDWGFCRYAPCFIDLTDYFTKEETRLYLEELHRLGISLSKKEFEEGVSIASFYPAFLYLYPALVQYKRGSDVRLNRLLTVLCRDSESGF